MRPSRPPARDARSKVAMTTRILVTGAAGLLGRAMVRVLSQRGDVLALGGRHARPGMLTGDLTDPAFLSGLEREDWDAVVHCAAFRSPDFCESNRETADRLNTGVPMALAQAARRRRARLVHVSTDYVFDGAHPPYSETDLCRPVNYYGVTKRKAEEGIQDVYPEALIMRIGALFAVPEPGTPSPFLEEAITTVLSRNPVEVDDQIRRYPLLTDEVAEVAAFLLGTPRAQGIVHVGSAQGVTRYEWTLRVARLLGRPAAHIRPTLSPFPLPAVRPTDVCLATARLAGWGGPVPRNVDVTLPEVVARSGQIIATLEKKLSEVESA